MYAEPAFQKGVDSAEQPSEGIFVKDPGWKREDQKIGLERWPKNIMNVIQNLQAFADLLSSS